MQPNSQIIPIEAVLLDMDGTILNSIKAAEHVWGAWAERHGINVEKFIPTIHGVQTIETVRRAGLHDIDPAAEAAAITQAEIDMVEGMKEIAGAAAFLAALPPGKWGIVTSASRALALSRIKAAGLPVPPLLISAEDVACGKPAPDCFLLGAEKLGTTADRCLIIEDSVAGIAAAEAAGATVLIITETHHRQMDVGHPTAVDYRGATLERFSDGSLSISLAKDAIRSQGDVCYLLKA
jgi:mannitol-1-/sugar-/sorbitol-6-phosphatase